VKIPVETVDEKTGELKKEVVSDVYCGAGEGVVTIAK
jgi:tRNA/tmRNA/rRNA uracil-C5-methylase (TrmA/RlmC/RlmD family)